MSKNSDERLNDAVAAIQEYSGRPDAKTIRDLLATKTGLERNALSERIAIGGIRLIKRDATTEKRRVKRAIRLASIIQPSQAETALNNLNNDSLVELIDKLRKLFPYRARPIIGNFEGRVHWDHTMSDPRNHDPTRFRYITHGIGAGASRGADTTLPKDGNLTEEQAKEAKEYNDMVEKYSDQPDALVFAERNMGPSTRKILDVNFCMRYLRDPDVLKTIVVSTALIDQDHVATYYPFGFILNVPAVNIYSAATRDQGVKNRADDLLFELQRVLTEKTGDNPENRILSPDDVLRGTGQVAGKTGYNEIVVVGTSPEGKCVEVNGLFVKVDGAGHLWVDPEQKQPYVTAEIAQLVRALAQARDIPIIGIRDNTGRALGGEVWSVRARDAFPNMLGA